MSLLKPHTLKALESELVYQEQTPALEDDAGYYQLFAELDNLNRIMMVERAKGDDGRARDVLREMAARCIRLMNIEPVEARSVYLAELGRLVPADELRTCTLFDTLHPKGMSLKLEGGKYVPDEPSWEEQQYVYQDWVELDTAFDRIARQLDTIHELGALTLPNAGDLFWIKDRQQYCILTAVIPPAHFPDPWRGTYMLRDSRVNRQTGRTYTGNDVGRLGGYDSDGNDVAYSRVPYDQTTWQEYDRKGVARLRDDTQWETDILSLTDPQRGDLFYVNVVEAYCIILRASTPDHVGEYMLRHAKNRTALDARAPYRVGDSHGPEMGPGAPGFTVRHKPGVPNGFDVVTDQDVVEQGK